MGNGELLAAYIHSSWREVPEPKNRSLGGALTAPRKKAVWI